MRNYNEIGRQKMEPKWPSQINPFSSAITHWESTTQATQRTPWVSLITPVAGSCNDNSSQTIFEKLAQAKHYHLENASVLRILGANYSSIFELNREENWNGNIPQPKKSSGDL
jgi:hypothetical protein